MSGGGGQDDPPLKLGLNDSLSRLDPQTSPFASLLTTDGAELELYAPGGEDRQQPHARDELYVVATGRARFRRADATVEVEAGDALFVPAWVSHRFEAFSDDFSTWVVFFGPERPRPDADAP